MVVGNVWIYLTMMTFAQRMIFRKSSKSFLLTKTISKEFLL